VTITLSVENTRQVQDAIAAYGARAEQALADAINATGLELRGEIVRAYQRGPATGRVYEKYNPRRTHQASAAGEAPATDTGRLANGMVYDRDGAAVVLSNSVSYAALLEYGTSRIDARQAWRPAVEAMRERFQARVDRAMRNAAGG
jgi:phage gpG-like protein